MAKLLGELVGGSPFPRKRYGQEEFAMVAGGVVRALYQVVMGYHPVFGVDDLRNSCQSRERFLSHHDIDLFMNRSSSYESVCSESKTNPDFKLKEGGEEQYVTRIISQKKLETKGRVLNAILVPYDSTPQAVLENFDIENVQVGLLWDGTWVVSKGFLDSEESHTVSLTPRGVSSFYNEYPSYPRVFKYYIADLTVHRTNFPWCLARCLGGEASAKITMLDKDTKMVGWYHRLSDAGSKFERSPSQQTAIFSEFGLEAKMIRCNSFEKWVLVDTFYRELEDNVGRLNRYEFNPDNMLCPRRIQDTAIQVATKVFGKEPEVLVRAPWT